MPAIQEECKSQRVLKSLAFTLMSAEGSRYNRGGFIELREYPRWFSGEMNADQLTIER